MMLYNQTTGLPRKPTVQDVNTIRQYRDAWRKNGLDDLDEKFDRTCKALMRAKDAKTRDRALTGIANCMRKHNMTQYGGRRISVPAMPGK